MLNACNSAACYRSRQSCNCESSTLPHPLRWRRVERRTLCSYWSPPPCCRWRAARSATNSLYANRRAAAGGPPTRTLRYFPLPIGRTLPIRRLRCRRRGRRPGRRPPFEDVAQEAASLFPVPPLPSTPFPSVQVLSPLGSGLAWLGSCLTLPPELMPPPPSQCSCSQGLPSPSRSARRGW
jgi:hypothetical protein